jgi:hypothetical protein
VLDNSPPVSASTRFAQATLPRRLSGLSIPFVCLILMTMLLLLLGSVREEALTSDEPAHITAGDASLRFRNARLNPEHLPLLKLLAAVPLLTLQLHFPLTSPAWQEGLNDQWTTAELFLYASGNDPHRIAALARLGQVSLTAMLGLVLFGWARR